MIFHCHVSFLGGKNKEDHRVFRGFFSAWFVFCHACATWDWWPKSRQSHAQPRRLNGTPQKLMVSADVFPHQCRCCGSFEMVNHITISVNFLGWVLQESRLTKQRGKAQRACFLIKPQIYILSPSTESTPKPTSPISTQTHHGLSVQISPHKYPQKRLARIPSSFIIVPMLSYHGNPAPSKLPPLSKIMTQ